MTVARTTRTLVLAAFAFAALAGAAFAQDREKDLKALRRNYDTMAKAFARSDTTAILALRTLTFHATLPDGQTQDAEIMRQGLHHFFVQNRPPIKVRYTIREAAFPDRDHAVLMVFQQASRFQDLGGKRRRVTHDVTQREAWVRTPVGWRFDAVDSIHAQHRWVDGKPVEPGKPYDPNAPPYRP